MENSSYFTPLGIGVFLVNLASPIAHIYMCLFLYRELMKAEWTDHIDFLSVSPIFLPFLQWIEKTPHIINLYSGAECLFYIVMKIKLF